SPDLLALAFLEGQPVLLEGVGAGRAFDLRIGLRRQRGDHHRDVVRGILEAIEVAARRHAGRRRKPDPRPGREHDIDRRRRQAERGAGDGGGGGGKGGGSEGRYLWPPLVGKMRRPSGGTGAPSFVPAPPGSVPRRIVRLIRPPSGSSVEVPGMMRSTPWKARRASPPST